MIRNQLTFKQSIEFIDNKALMHFIINYSANEFSTKNYFSVTSTPTDFSIPSLIFSIARLRFSTKNKPVMPQKRC